MRRAPAVKHAFPEQGGHPYAMQPNNRLGSHPSLQCLQQCEHNWFHGAPSTRRCLRTGPLSVQNRAPPRPRQTRTRGHQDLRPFNARKGCQAWGLSQAKSRLPWSCRPKQPNPAREPTQACRHTSGIRRHVHTGLCVRIPCKCLPLHLEPLGPTNAADCWLLACKNKRVEWEDKHFSRR